MHCIYIHTANIKTKNDRKKTEKKSRKMALYHVVCHDIYRNENVLPRSTTKQSWSDNVCCGEEGKNVNIIIINTSNLNLKK